MIQPNPFRLRHGKQPRYSKDRVERKIKMAIESTAVKLTRTFVELADNLVAGFDVVELLTLLTDRCVEVLEVGAAGIMLVGPDGNLRLMASSSEAIRLLELHELQSKEGPCLDCFHSGLPVINHDLALTGERWPRFSTQALDAGFHSVAALPMRLRGTVIGALTLLNTEPGELKQGEEMSAQALADIATIAILQHRASHEAQILTEQLRNALESRIVIEQAKGVMAERQSLTMEQAFSTIRAYARNHNRPLIEVATDVVNNSVVITHVEVGIRM